MDFSRTAIPGLLEFSTTPHHDDRGFFSRTFEADTARTAGLRPEAFVEDSLSRSVSGVLRGIHVRTGLGEGKLVRCSHGRVFDVVVDLRPTSPTYLTWLSFILDGEAQNSLYVPPGCGHAFQALTPLADTSYRIDRPHDSSENLTIRYDDPQLAIPWPMQVTVQSAGDRDARTLAELPQELRTIRAVP